MSVFVVIFILAFFAAFALYVWRDLEELAHEQLVDELWDDGDGDVSGGRPSSDGSEPSVATAVRCTPAAADDPLGGAA